jgi:hypothetical protein
MDIKKEVKEILKKNNIEYSIRDYYKLEKKDPKMIGLAKQYGITYFIVLPTEQFNLKLSVFKKSKSILITYEDDGCNNYLSIRSSINDFNENISMSMYLIESHLKSIRDMETFESGKIPIDANRVKKIESLSK